MDNLVQILILVAIAGGIYMLVKNGTINVGSYKKYFEGYEDGPMPNVLPYTAYEPAPPATVPGTAPPAPNPVPSASPIAQSTMLNPDAPAGAPTYPGPFEGCFPKQQNLAPEDLLPKDMNSKWAQANPAGQGNLNDRNFLESGFHVGINTVGQSLRNANYQLRSDIPNPQMKVSPWLQSTIEPDVNRRPMEIGGAF